MAPRPRRRARGLLPFAVVVALAAALALGEAFGGGGKHVRTAPPLPTAVLVPPRIGIADLHGRPAVIAFWASWCEPCHREAPALRVMQARLGGRARVVGVDWNDDAGSARAFIRRYRWRFPTLRDADGLAGDAYGITGLPMTILLDRDGRIAARLNGPQDAASIQRALARAL